MVMRVGRGVEGKREAEFEKRWGSGQRFSPCKSELYGQSPNPHL